MTDSPKNLKLADIKSAFTLQNPPENIIIEVALAAIPEKIREQFLKALIQDHPSIMSEYSHSDSISKIPAELRQDMLRILGEVEYQNRPWYRKFMDIIEGLRLIG